MERVITDQPRLKTAHGSQRHLGPIEFSDGDSPVERDDRRRIKTDQLIVEGEDL